VQYPTKLDMSPYVVAGEGEASGCRYRLAAVIVHRGTLDAGHYIAYVRCNSNEFHDDRRYLS